jgi:NAD+ kinase
MADSEKKINIALSAVIFINVNKKNAESTALEIRKELENRGAEVTLFAIDGCAPSFPGGNWDIAFTLGGDGTVLYAARMLASSGTPILPLHLGTLGFLAGIEKCQWLDIYEKWLNKTVRLSRRCMLEFSVERKKNKVYGNTCLNDVVISSEGIAKLIRLRVQTEDTPGDCSELGYYRSDGLIIATPTGSTAYSMAAGGPILNPEMEAQILTPVCPFTLSNRPLVLPSRQTLLVTVEKEQRSGVLLTIDGQDTFELEPSDVVTVRHSPYYAQLITSDNSAYYSALREKLSWGNGYA